MTATSESLSPLWQAPIEGAPCSGRLAAVLPLSRLSPALRARKPTRRVTCAFDLLELDGVDYRPLPLRQRKDCLARLLAGVQVGIAINEHTDEDGAVVFLHACKMGLEGIVSKKRLTAPYHSGPSRDWIKVKNPDSPAMRRARERRW
jgi:ATP-dependent DNA ligase